MHNWRILFTRNIYKQNLYAFKITSSLIVEFLCDILVLLCKYDIKIKSSINGEFIFQSIISESYVLWIKIKKIKLTLKLPDLK